MARLSCLREKALHALEYCWVSCSPLRARHMSHDFDRRTHRKEAIKIKTLLEWLMWQCRSNRTCDALQKGTSATFWLNTKAQEETAKKRYCRNVVCKAAFESCRRVIGGAWRPRFLDVRLRHVLAIAPPPVADGLSSAAIVCSIAEQTNKINIVYRECFFKASVQRGRFCRLLYKKVCCNHWGFCKQFDG